MKSKKTIIAGIAALGMVAAMGAPSITPMSYSQKAVVRQASKRDTAKQKRHDRRKENERNYHAKTSWFKKLQERFTGEDSKRYSLIQKMTNWQNHQWMKAGSPKDINRVEKFATMARS